MDNATLIASLPRVAAPLRWEVKYYTTELKIGDYVVGWLGHSGYWWKRGMSQEIWTSDAPSAARALLEALNIPEEPERLTESEVGRIDRILTLYENRVRKDREQLDDCESRGLVGYAGDWRQWLKDDEDVVFGLRKLLALHASLDPAPAAQSTEPETGKEGT